MKHSLLRTQFDFWAGIRRAHEELGERAQDLRDEPGSARARLPARACLTSQSPYNPNTLVAPLRDDCGLDYVSAAKTGDPSGVTSATASPLVALGEGYVVGLAVACAEKQAK